MDRLSREELERYGGIEIDPCTVAVPVPPDQTGGNRMYEKWGLDPTGTDYVRVDDTPLTLGELRRMKRRI